MKTITLDKQLTEEQEQWIVKNIGPRMHYLHNSIGGLGWIVKKQFKPGMAGTYWELTLENDSYATFFVIKFST
jgi:hypothetical protein